MKAQPVLFSLLLIIIAFLRGSQSFFNHSSTLSEKIVLGKLDEDVILPCSFESGPNIIIHWKNQDYNVHTYYKDNDHLEKQDPRYTNRTSLFHREIHNGNASLCFRRLSLPDEGSYMCYVATSSMKITSKVVLKVGDGLHKMRRENVLLSCELANYFFLPNQDFIVTWSRMKSGTFPQIYFSHLSNSACRKEYCPYGWESYQC
uniref:HERV-H LTR-associating 2 n=1 Tax=Rousettus aegyptiacus TaxID=9407 RepID=A0A7J8HPZ6_ROUAE|nr:HERV-H LTR-associating 2 [Rousettus aegyptiacus]